ncbi:MAG TPA: alpha/beta fold hydrolase [Ramlibacter sp.]|nr:alpha/beta fold hydrolase [Ramlibacter sp.]
MTESADEFPLSPAAPIAFDAAAGWCFGWFHAARPPVRDLAVVLCRPLGQEAIFSYPSLAQLAEKLADAGYPVVRFDYQGTGDSSGSDEEPGRVAAWLASIEAAVEEAKALARVPRVALVGVRMGATLAAHAASRLGGVDALVMWAPCASGRAFVRELRAASGTVAPGGAIEAMGFTYTGQTLEDLQRLDCTALPSAPARHAFVIGRDDLPAEGPVPRALRQLGVETRFESLPGYAAMMVEPHEGVLEHGTLAAIIDWLGTVPPAAGIEAVQRPLPPPPDCVTQGVRETPLRFGPAQSLFGIMAEPHDRAAHDRRSQTAVILLNVGGNYRIGPHRIYVEMARAIAACGWRVLRLDLAGIGDSPLPPGVAHASLYNKDSTADVRAAIDALALQGCKEFVLMGICSGSYVAFQTSLADPRVHSQVLMNSRLLEWQPGKEGDTWQNSMQRYYKSTDFYLRALVRPQVWWRVLRGEVDVRGIARRFASVGAAWLRRALQRLRREQGEDLLAKMRRLCSRGTDTLMLIAAEDDGRDYVEFHFGPLGRRLRSNGNFRMVIVDDADHTFSRASSRRFVVATLLDHLARRPQVEDPGQPAAEGPPAWVGSPRSSG